MPNEKTQSQTAKPHPVSEFRLLSQLMADASPDEVEFMRKLLKGCYRSVHPLQASVLHIAAAEFNLGMCIDDMETNAEAFRALSLILAQGGWLARVLGQLFHKILKEQEVSFDDLFFLVDLELQQHHANVESAREMLRSVPQELAEEIQQAASRLKVKVS